MKTFIVLLGIIFLPAFSGKYASVLYAQKQGQALIDSLVKVLASDNYRDKEDTNKAEILGLISFGYCNINPDSGIKYGLIGLGLAEKLKWKKGLANMYYGLATNYQVKSDYPSALECCFKSLKFGEDIGNKSVMAVSLINIAKVYERQGAYPKALEYLSKAEKVSDDTGDKELMNDVTGNIGAMYLHEKKDSLALAYFLKSVKMSEGLGDNEFLASDYTNIGVVYSQQKDYPKALEYYQKSLEIYRQSNSDVYTATALVNIGEICQAKGEYTKAIDYYSQGIAIFRKIEDINDVQLALQELSGAEEQSGNTAAALKNYKEYVSLKDSTFNIENNVKITNLETKRQLELKQKQIEIDKLDLVKKRNERWFFVVTIIFLTLLGVLFINRQRLAQKKLLAEKTHAENELEVFKKNVSEKNLVIEQVTEEIERLKTGAQQQVDNELVSQLERSILLTDEQWENFRILFEKVHKGFFAGLKAKMPELTQTEVRFLALTKLKLSPKEMASMLGISTGTIRSYRFRLRKKLDMDKDDTIEELV